MAKRLQGLIAGIIIGTLLTGGTVFAAFTERTITVSSGVQIYVDDRKLEPKDANGNPVEPFVYNGTTYLPVRAVSDALGIAVTWDGATQSVYIGKHSSDKPAAYLQDLDYFTGKELETMASDKDNFGNMRTNIITDQFYTRGVHSYGGFTNVYKINGQYSKIDGYLYLRYDERNLAVEQPDNISKGGIHIYGDGRLLASFACSAEPQYFSADLTGVLELKVEYTPYSGKAFYLSDVGLWQ